LCNAIVSLMSALFRATRAADFDRLYRRHAPSVYRYAYAVLGNQADAEDVTQQTFLNAYRAIAEGTKPRKAENWLLRIAHNELRRHFRTNGRAIEVEFDERLAQPVREASEPSLADVLRALRQLPPIQRSALVMREFEGRSYAEIAEVLDVSQSALEALIFRARRALAENLEGALTCTEAEQAVSRRLDGRLARREARRLKAHLNECALCVRFATVQKRQRSLLKGLSVMPIPASLFLFRGEPAAAAAALGGSGAAVGGASAVGGTAAGAGAGGLAAGLVAKAAAVTAAAAVAGGVGYDVATGPARATETGGKVAGAAAVAKAPAGGRTQLIATPPSEHQLSPRPSAVAPARRKAAKAKLRPANRAPQAENVAAKKRTARSQGLRKQPVLVIKTRPPRPAPKSSTHAARTRTRGTNRPGVGKRPDAKPSRPARGSEKPKPRDVVDPLAASNAEPAPKKPHG
jgi:RNA polymerase sigma factor (sigma-70 family)